MTDSREKSSNYRWVRPIWTEEESKAARAYTEKMVREIAEREGLSEEWVQAVLRPQ